MNNGNINNNNKNNTYRVRPVAPVVVGSPVPATPRAVYDIPFSSVIEAWIDCERNKRSSNSCVKFRWHAARDLHKLWIEMRSGTYKPLASMVFMIAYPALREVWAASFRDRVVHHWEYLRFGPVVERFFVSVGDCSMNCRKGYGSLRAVYTFQKAIYDYTEGYARQDCYIVGGDFSNFFMSIDKDILWAGLEQLIMDEYEGADKPALLYMISATLRHKGTENFYRKSPIEMWENLPPRKSLFHMPGLEIGNLPNQIWANFIGALFTIWIIFIKKIDGFIIFVDDWRCLVRTEEEGRRLLKEAAKFLDEKLHVTLHPDKIYLQHYTKGTKMVGAVVKPYRTYVSNRTRGHFITTMLKFNARAKATDEAGRVGMLAELRSSVNSYLGMMVHHRSYNVRRRVAEEHILPTWGRYLYFDEEFSRCVIKREYDPVRRLRRRLRSRKFAAKFIRPKWQGNGPK